MASRPARASVALFALLLVMPVVTGLAPPRRNTCAHRGSTPRAASEDRAVAGAMKQGKVRATRQLKTKQWGGSKPRRRANQGRALEVGMTNPSRLKVMGGSAKGRRLDSPEVQLRPMMGKVKEALFSTLTGFGLFDRAGTRVLDVFSGSGSVGIEALSRGAQHAVFVDFAKECIEVAERNAVWCGFEPPEHTATGVCAAAETVLEQPQRFKLDQPFDLITITPPYEEVVYADLLQTIADSPLVGQDTVVVVEYPTELGTLPPAIAGKLVGVRNRKYGRTVLAIYVCSPSGKWNLDVRSEEFIPDVQRRR